MFQKRGIITYNGHKLDEFCVQRTSAYISQTDNHIAELTVRETLDYAARFQGASQGFAGLSKHFHFMYLTNSILVAHADVCHSFPEISHIIFVKSIT